MKNSSFFPVLLFCFLLFLSASAFAQCTEAKDADMAKYKRLTETQDAQGCSQCAVLALYMCSARHSVAVEDKRVVSSLITQTKRNIIDMGQPYCCPELVNKEPQWGIDVAGNASSGQTTADNANGTTNTNNSNSGLIPSQPQSKAENLLNTIANRMEANQSYIDNKDTEGMSKQADASMMEYQLNQLITGKPDLELAGAALLDATASTLLTANVNQEKYEKIKPELEKWSREVNETVSTYTKLEENISHLYRPIVNISTATKVSSEWPEFSYQGNIIKFKDTQETIIKVDLIISKESKSESKSKKIKYSDIKKMVSIIDEHNDGFIILNTKTQTLSSIFNQSEEVTEKGKEINKGNDKLNRIHKAGPLLIAFSDPGFKGKIKDLTVFDYNSLKKINFDFNFDDYTVPINDYLDFFVYNDNLITFILNKKEFIPNYVTFKLSGGKPVSVVSMEDYYPKAFDITAEKSIGPMYNTPILNNSDNIIAAVNYNDVYISDKIPEDSNIEILKKGAGYNYILEINRVNGKVVRKIGEVGSRILGMTISPDNKFLFVLRGSLDYKLEMYDLLSGSLIGTAPILEPKHIFDKYTGELKHYRNYMIAHLRFNLPANELVIAIEPEHNFTANIHSPDKVRDEAGKVLVLDLVSLLNEMSQQTPQIASTSETNESKLKETNTNNSSITEELKKIKSLYDEGTITKEQFEAAKNKLLGIKNN